jgi:hypothetical protein
MLVLASGLIVAQLVERGGQPGRARLPCSSAQAACRPAQRIADIVTLLDSLSPVERERIVVILNVPPLVVSLDRTPSSEDSMATGGARAAMFSSVLRRARWVTTGRFECHERYTPGMGARRGRGRGQGPMGAGPMADRACTAFPGREFCS